MPFPFNLSAYTDTESIDVLDPGQGRLRLHLIEIESRSLLLIEQREPPGSGPRVVPLTPVEYRLIAPLIRMAARTPRAEGEESAPPRPGESPRRLLVLPGCIHRRTLQRLAQVQRPQSVIEHLSRAARKLEVWGLTVARGGAGFCLCSYLPWWEAEDGEEASLME